jgi:hypothetical protein
MNDEVCGEARYADMDGPDFADLSQSHGSGMRRCGREGRCGGEKLALPDSLSTTVGPKKNQSLCRNNATDTFQDVRLSLFGQSWGHFP